MSERSKLIDTVQLGEHALNIITTKVLNPDEAILVSFPSRYPGESLDDYLERVARSKRWAKLVNLGKKKTDE